MPLVSILIPAYNASKFIRRTIQSCLDQSHQDLEVIIVDDGSTDDTLGEVRSLAYVDSRIRFYSTKNSGQTAALNRAYSESRGAYIQFLDADDLLAPNKISLQLDALAGRDRAVSLSSWKRFNKDFNYEQASGKVPNGNVVSVNPLDWLIDNWKRGGGMLFPARWLIPRSIIDICGPWREDLSLLNDTEYFPRLLTYCSEVVICEEAMCGYRSGVTGSLSGVRSRQHILSGYQVFYSTEIRLLSRWDDDRLRVALSFCWQRFARSYYPDWPDLAELALKRANALSSERLPLEGGSVYLVVAKLFGWRFARRLQRLSGRQ